MRESCSICFSLHALASPLSEYICLRLAFLLCCYSLPFSAWPPFEHLNIVIFVRGTLSNCGYFVLQILLYLTGCQRSEMSVPHFYVTHLISEWLCACRNSNRKGDFDKLIELWSVLSVFIDALLQKCLSMFRVSWWRNELQCSRLLHRSFSVPSTSFSVVELTYIDESCMCKKSDDDIFVLWQGTVMCCHCNKYQFTYCRFLLLHFDKTLPSVPRTLAFSVNNVIVIIIAWSDYILLCQYPAVKLQYGDFCSSFILMYDVSLEAEMLVDAMLFSVLYRAYMWSLLTRKWKVSMFVAQL